MPRTSVTRCPGGVVHTCTLDHPAALGNFLDRGFKVFKEELGVKVGERYVSQPQIVPFEDSIGTVTRAHQRPGSDFGESQSQPPLPILVELIGVHPTGNG